MVTTRVASLLLADRYRDPGPRKYVIPGLWDTSAELSPDLIPIGERRPQ